MIVNTDDCQSFSELENRVAEDMLNHGFDPWDAEQVQAYWKERLDDV